MDELTGYRCPNCGQMLPISRSGIFTCEFCGSQYEKENSWLRPLTVQVCTARLQKLVAKEYIPDHVVKELDAANCKGDYSEMVLKRMAHQLGESLIPFMKIRTYKDIKTMTTIIGAEVRVAEPDFRC